MFREDKLMEADARSLKTSKSGIHYQFESLPVRRGGEFVVATDAMHGSHLLPAALLDVGRRYPNFNVSIEVMDVDSAIQKLVHQEVDLVVQTGPCRPSPNVTIASVHHWNYVAMFPADKEVTSPMSLIDLQEQPLLTLSSAVPFQGGGDASGHLPVKAHDMSLISSLVKMGVGVGVVPAFVCDARADSGIQLVEIDPIFASAQTYLLVRSATYPGALIKQLIKAVAIRMPPALVRAGIPACVL